MSKIGVGKIIGVGGSMAVRLPAVVTKDDAFSFAEGDEVVVQLDGNKCLRVCKE